MLKKILIACFLLPVALTCAAEQKYAVKGMVLKIDAPNKTLVVSCQDIPGYMEAMAMPFHVRDTKELEGLTPGTPIAFTLVVESDKSFAESIQAQPYQGLEVDPLTARRLKLLNQATNPNAPKMLAIGDRVPDFTLLDQNRQQIAFAKFAGEVVALNFIYTRCALPDFCFRSSNNFGQLQKRFKENLGKNLILLTVTFDPAHDQPDALQKYAETWKADSRSWHFLTGSSEDVRRVCDLFGVDAYPDEGLMNHSLHTVVIDRKGNLAANLEGNQFTSAQLGDLVQTVLDRR